MLKAVTICLALALGLTSAVAGMQSQDHDLTIKACTELLEKYKLDDPSKAAVYYNRANAHDDKKNYPAAIADYDKAIEIKPDLQTAYYNRGRALRISGQPELAIASYNKALELDPKDANSFSNRGHAYRDVGDNDKAIADFRSALAIDPTHDRALAHLKELGVEP
jgi:tetratricopeptide (TPR) repeat protein